MQSDASKLHKGRIIPASELVLNPDGSVYHIRLKAEHIADKVIVVGDQGRVARITKHFTNVEPEIHNREFYTQSGEYKGQRITVMSTGIGPDNIDISINELDAAINIDPETRMIRENLRSLDIVRIGTCGALQEDLPVDSFVVSEYGMGMDGLLHYYHHQPNIEEATLTRAFVKQTGWNPDLSTPYFVRGGEELVKTLAEGWHKGITATAPGFYGPQGRVLRLPVSNNQINEQLTAFEHNGLRITNFEMETSALYGLGTMLGHRTATVCAIIANRIRMEFSKDYKKTVDSLIVEVLERLTR